MPKGTITRLVDADEKVGPLIFVRPDDGHHATHASGELVIEAPHGDHKIGDVVEFEGDAEAGKLVLVQPAPTV